jgi:hypothetical protein
MPYGQLEPELIDLTLSLFSVSMDERDELTYAGRLYEREYTMLTAFLYQQQASDRYRGCWRVEDEGARDMSYKRGDTRALEMSRKSMFDARGGLETFKYRPNPLLVAKRTWWSLV